MCPSPSKIKIDSDDEVLACFKEEDFPKFHTGKISALIFPKTRGQAHIDGTPHIIVRVYAFSPAGDILVQKRSDTRKCYPGHFTDSASGHLRYSPDISFEYIEQEAWREMGEEMGVKVLWGRLWDINFEDGENEEKELAYNFLAIVEDDLHLDPHETGSESGFFSPEALQVLIETQPFVKVALKYWNFVLSQNIDRQILAEYIASNKGEVLSVIDQPSSAQEGVKDIAALVGRFQPFHLGHLQLIQAILQEHRFVKIAVGSSQYSHTRDNPFTYLERKGMITQALLNAGVDSARYRVYPLPDLHNMTRWAAELFRVVGEFNIFYSNNEWIRQIMLGHGKKLGRPLKFDFKRLNGTKIRQLIASKKSIENFVPESVIRYLHELGAHSRFE